MATSLNLPTLNRIPPPSSLRPKPLLPPPSPLLLRSPLRPPQLTIPSVVVACLPLSSPPPTSPAVVNRLYVSGLSFRTTEESLRGAFQKFGQLVEVNLVMDRVANRPKGYGFLRYNTEDEAKKAIEGMHGKFLDGRVIFVEVAKPRSAVRQSPKQYPRPF